MADCYGAAGACRPPCFAEIGTVLQHDDGGHDDTNVDVARICHLDIAAADGNRRCVSLVQNLVLESSDCIVPERSARGRGLVSARDAGPRELRLKSASVWRHRAGDFRHWRHRPRRELPVYNCPDCPRLSVLGPCVPRAD